jgi:hypothetical protein
VSGTYRDEYNQIKNGLFNLIYIEFQQLDGLTSLEDLKNDNVELSLQRLRCKRMLDTLEELGLKESFVFYRDWISQPAYKEQKIAIPGA